MNTRERIIKIAYGLNELNRISGHLDLYRASRCSIDIAGKKQDFQICFSIYFERFAYKDGNYIILSIRNSKVKISGVRKDKIFLPTNVETVLELIQDKDIKTLIIDNLDLW